MPEGYFPGLDHTQPVDTTTVQESVKRLGKDPVILTPASLREIVHQYVDPRSKKSRLATHRQHQSSGTSLQYVLVDTGGGTSVYVGKGPIQKVLQTVQSMPGAEVLDVGEFVIGYNRQQASQPGIIHEHLGIHYPHSAFEILKQYDYNLQGQLTPEEREQRFITAVGPIVEEGLPGLTRTEEAGFNWYEFQQDFMDENLYNMLETSEKHPQIEFSFTPETVNEFAKCLASIGTERRGIVEKGQRRGSRFQAQVSYATARTEEGKTVYRLEYAFYSLGANKVTYTEEYTVDLRRNEEKYPGVSETNLNLVGKYSLYQTINVRLSLLNEYLKRVYESKKLQIPDRVEGGLTKSYSIIDALIATPDGEGVIDPGVMDDLLERGSEWHIGSFAQISEQREEVDLDFVPPSPEEEVFS